MQIDKSSVRRRVASFEALMHSNTTAMVACEAAYVDGGTPLGELQMQPQSFLVAEPNKPLKSDLLQPSVSSRQFADFQHVQQLGCQPAEGSKQKGSGTPQSRSAALTKEADVSPSSSGDTENIKPATQYWQVQAPEAAAAPHSVSGSAPTLKKAVSSQAAASMDWPPVPSAAGRELEMVETVSDQPSCHGEEELLEYSEVQIRIRLPRYTGDTTAGGEGRRCATCGSATGSTRASLDGTVDRLREELAAKERERRHTAEALQRKQSECENLSRVVRELAESRAQLVACRAVQSERIEELQAECMRIMRIADLSRTVSKENITKATQAKKHARQAEEEALQQKRAATIVRDCNKDLRLEVLELREKICLLERLPLLHHGGQSACMQEFVFTSLKDTAQQPFCAA
ncbi:hypothetical protein WJX84_007628 [Apatococcus fuscideae]|uniref:Uncharacterized protein n=1 Tax=Apatococcus fuscideae TaxID=2026836 RepID=A0AAW1SZ50_9CHLO